MFIFSALSPWINPLETGIITRKHVLLRVHFPNKISMGLVVGEIKIFQILCNISKLFFLNWFWQYLLHAFPQKCLLQNCRMDM